MGVINVFQSWGVLPISVKCPECGDVMFLKKNDSKNKDYVDGYYFVCKRNESQQNPGHKKNTCNKHISIRTNTIFHNSKQTLHGMLTFVIFWVGGNSLAFSRRQWDICATTARKWSVFFRDVIIYYMMINTKPIGGPGKFVEINDYKYVKRYHREHCVDGQWVFGGIERGNWSNLFMVPVEKRDSAALLAVIEKWILPGSTIVSNGWTTYSNLAKFGYKQEIVDHRILFIDKKGKQTNRIKGDWAEVKPSLPPYNKRKHKFTSYLAKYLFAKICKYHKEDAVKTLFMTAARFHTDNDLFAEQFSPVNDVDDDSANDVDDDSDNDLDNNSDNDL